MSTHTTRITLIALCAAGLWFTGFATEEHASRPSPSTSAVSPQTTDTQTTPVTNEPSGTVTGTRAADDSSSTEPISAFSTESQQSPQWPEYGDASDVYPTAVRGAVHDGFERVVIEHAGTGQPSFLAQYTDEPLEPGRGQPVDTGDEAYLEVTLSGTADAYDNPPDMLEHGAQIMELNTEASQTVVSFLPWEGTSTYYVGLDEKRPYSVTVLEDPVRVVIDIELTDQ